MTRAVNAGRAVFTQQNAQPFEVNANAMWTPSSGSIARFRNGATYLGWVDDTGNSGDIQMTGGVFFRAS